MIYPTGGIAINCAIHRANGIMDGSPEGVGIRPDIGEIE